MLIKKHKIVYTPLWKQMKNMNAHIYIPQGHKYWKQLWMKTIWEGSGIISDF